MTVECDVPSIAVISLSSFRSHFAPRGRRDHLKKTLDAGLLDGGESGNVCPHCSLDIGKVIVDSFIQPHIQPYVPSFPSRCETLFVEDDPVPSTTGCATTFPLHFLAHF